MLILRLEFLSNEIVRYRYYPEDREDFGLIELNRITGEINLKAEVKEYGSFYWRHAVYRIDEYFEADNFPEKDMVAWY